MVQSYLKKVGHRTFTANKKGGNREFFPHFPSPFAFLIATTKNCHVGIAISTHGLKESKQLFWRQFSVSDDADFILLQLKIGLQFQLFICPIVHCPLPWRQSVSVIGDLPMISCCRKLLLIQSSFFTSRLWLILKIAEERHLS